MKRPLIFKMISYVFMSEKNKIIANLESDLETANDIYSIIHSRKQNFDRRIFLDFDFEKTEKEKLTILGYYKYGALEFFDEEIQRLILKVINSDAGDLAYEKELNHLYNFLIGFQSRIRMEINRRKTNI
jgi:hypothetical protein